MAGSGFFERALKRVLIFPREVDDLADLGLGHFVGEHAAHPTPCWWTWSMTRVASSMLIEKNCCRHRTTNSIGV